MISTTIIVNKKFIIEADADFWSKKAPIYICKQKVSKNIVFPLDNRQNFSYLMGVTATMLPPLPKKRIKR